MTVIVREIYSSCELKVHYDLKKTMFRPIQKYLFSILTYERLVCCSVCPLPAFSLVLIIFAVFKRFAGVSDSGER